MKVLVVKLSLMFVLSQLNQFPLSNSISLISLLMYLSFLRAGFESRLFRFGYQTLMCGFLFPYDLTNSCNLLFYGKKFLSNFQSKRSSKHYLKIQFLLSRNKLPLLQIQTFDDGYEGKCSFSWKCYQT